MATKYNSLEELRLKKRSLQREVTEMEHLISFDNAKESLSSFTNGFSDKFLKESQSENGEVTTHLKTDVLMRELTKGVTKSILNKNTALSFAQNSTKNGLLEEVAKLGITTLIGSYTQKNLKNSNWKKRALAMAVVYVAPIAIRYGIKKLEEYQKNKSVASFEQLI